MKITTLLTALIVSAFLLVGGGSVFAGTDYYISNHPGSGSGTREDPFGLADLPVAERFMTPGKAMSVLQPGDTLWFIGGEYELHTGESRIYWAMGYICPAVSGEPDRPISFRAMPGERVVLRVVSGGQSALGNRARGGARDYVVYEGFITEGASVGHITGKGAVVRYCEIVGRHRDTRDNNDGIRIEGAEGAWIHNNIIHSSQGLSQNSAGIKVYTSKNIIVENNYIHSNTCGIFDKDSGVNNTYRFNYFTNNPHSAFHGNNQGGYMSARIHDNVFDGRIALGVIVDGVDVYNNLVRHDSLTGHWAGRLWNVRVWNNVVLTESDAITAYNESQRQLINEGERKHLEYMDYNVYTAPPQYTFGRYDRERGPQRFDLEQFRELGFERNSQVVSKWEEIYRDQESWELLPRWQTAGRDGTRVGPEDVARILDLSRYGPDARPE